MKKKDHGFEREQGGVDGRVWREEREVRSVVIIILKIRIKCSVKKKKETRAYM